MLKGEVKENVGYSALHKWVYRELGKARKCEGCGLTEGRVEWANKSHNYLRDRGDWLQLCCSCHQEYDQSGFKVLKKDKVAKVCVNCGRNFLVFPYRENTAKFCSRLCYGR